MKISELIRILQVAQYEVGDIKVQVDATDEEDYQVNVAGVWVGLGDTVMLGYDRPSDHPDLLEFWREPRKQQLGD
jgi:hypothetical protein